MGNYVPIIRRTHPNQHAIQSPIQSEKYQCHIDTVSSPDDRYIPVALQPYRALTDRAAAADQRS